MALERFYVLIWFTLPFVFHSPCDCNPSLVFGVSDSRGNPTPSIETSMDAVPLLVRIKVRCREACGDEIQVVDLGLDSHVYDGIDSTIPIRSSSCCVNILEGKGLIKGTREFVLSSLL